MDVNEKGSNRLFEIRFDPLILLFISVYSLIVELLTDQTPILGTTRLRNVHSLQLLEPGYPDVGRRFGERR